VRAGDLDGDGLPRSLHCHYCDWSFANNRPVSLPAMALRGVPATRFASTCTHALPHEKGTKFRDVSAEHGFTALGRGLGVLFGRCQRRRPAGIYVANDMSFHFLTSIAARQTRRARWIWLASGKRSRAAGWSMGVMPVTTTELVARRSGLRTIRASGTRCTRTSERETSTTNRMRRELRVGSVLRWIRNGLVDIDNDGWERHCDPERTRQRNPSRQPIKQRPVLLHNIESRNKRFFGC